MNISVICKRNSPRIPISEYVVTRLASELQEFAQKQKDGQMAVTKKIDNTIVVFHAEFEKEQEKVLKKS